MSGGDAYRGVISLLSQPNAFTKNAVQLDSFIQQFISLHDDVETGSITGAQIDDTRQLFAAMLMQPVPSNIEIGLISMVKILLRKSSNRNDLKKAQMSIIIQKLKQLLSDKNLVATAELCNVILNACYDGCNIQLLLECEGLKQLLRVLTVCYTRVLVRGVDNSAHFKLVSSVLGAIQGVCYVPLGRQYIRQEIQIFEQLINYLSSEDAMIRARAIGAIHNISVDMVSIQPIYSTPNSIEAIVNLLRDDNHEVCQAASGTLQNLSRDALVRESILASKALMYLTDLLCSSEVDCQVC